MHAMQPSRKKHFDEVDITIAALTGIAILAAFMVAGFGVAELWFSGTLEGHICQILGTCLGAYCGGLFIYKRLRQ
ncbi:hypothetical protein ACLMNJ_36630 [Streptomyces seoulensis]